MGLQEKITLDEFNNLFFCQHGGNATVYVFDNEDIFDAFAMGKNNVDVLFTIGSSLRCRAYLQEKYWKAPVCEFYALGEATIAVWIDND